MNSHSCLDADDLAQKAHHWCREKIKQYGAGSIYLPAGNTPKTLYALWERENPPYLKGLTLVQIDDLVDGPKAGLFRQFFSEHLPGFQAQMKSPLDGDFQADLAILGLGLNGHVGFHEPGLPPDFFRGLVDLGVKTCTNLGIPGGSKGLTFGLSAFLHAKAILLMVDGAGKEEVFKQVLKGDKNIPAGTLMSHRDFKILSTLPIP